MAEHEVAGAEAGLELSRDLEKGHRRGGVLGERRCTADDEHEPRSLHADEHISVEVPRGAAQLINVEHARRRANKHTHLAVAVPAEGGNARGQLGVVFAAEDAVNDERLQPGIPQASGLGRAGIDVCGGKGDLTGVQQNRLAQHVIPGANARFDDLHGEPDQLQRLGERDRAQQLAGGSAEDVSGNPRCGFGVLEPADKRADARLRDHADRRASAGRHLSVPRQRVVQPFQRRRGQLTRNGAQPSERLRLGLASHRLALASSVSTRTCGDIVQRILGDGGGGCRGIDLSALDKHLKSAHDH